MKKPLGIQTMLELYDCNVDLLDDHNFIQGAMMEAARRSKATIVQDFFHQFSPQGVSGVVIIAESHLSIHTWPEFGYAAIDIFTCSEDMDIEAAFQYLVEAFKSLRYDTRAFERGLAL